MLSENASEFLGQLGKIAEDHFNECYVEEQENGPILLMSSPSPFEEDEEIAYSVQIEDGKNGFVLLQYLIMPFAHIPEEKLDELGKAICYIDPTLSYGNFVLVKEGKLLLFRQSAIVPDDMDEMAAIQYSARSLFLMERTVFETGNMLYGLLNGQVTLEEIKSALAAQ